MVQPAFCSCACENSKSSHCFIPSSRLDYFVSSRYLLPINFRRGLIIREYRLPFAFFIVITFAMPGPSCASPRHPPNRLGAIVSDLTAPGLNSFRAIPRMFSNPYSVDHCTLTLTTGQAGQGIKLRADPRTLLGSRLHYHRLYLGRMDRTTLPPRDKQGNL